MLRESSRNERETGQWTHINGQTDRRILFCQVNIQTLTLSLIFSSQHFPHLRISRCPSSGELPQSVPPVKNPFTLWSLSLLQTGNVSTGTVSSVKPRAAGITLVEGDGRSLQVVIFSSSLTEKDLHKHQDGYNICSKCYDSLYRPRVSSSGSSPRHVWSD